MGLDLKSLKLKLNRDENFSGKSVLSVYQDFHAKVFSKNLISALGFPMQLFLLKIRLYNPKANEVQIQCKDAIASVLCIDRSSLFSPAILEPISFKKSFAGVKFGLFFCNRFLTYI